MLLKKKIFITRNKCHLSGTPQSCENVNHFPQRVLCYPMSFQLGSFDESSAVGSDSGGTHFGGSNFTVFL